MASSSAFLANCVGTNFRPAQARAACEELFVGVDYLQLEREPNNHYDSNAIRVYIGDSRDDNAFIGFIEAGVAANLAPRMDEGGTFTIVIEAPVHARGVWWLLRIEEFDSPNIMGLNVNAGVE